jgi:hypothetical protein
MISDEENIYNTKPGDFGGFCLAWCLWYIEHRIINYKCTQKELFPKIIDKLLTIEDKLSIYIRNYANYINKYRLDLLLKIGIPKNKLTNEEFEEDEIKLIKKFINKKLLK